MEQWLHDIFNLLPGGMIFAAAVLVIAFFEALVGIGLIMPGSVLTVFCGWLAFQGKASIITVMTAAGLGALLGDIVSYWLGARFGIHLWKWKFLQKRQALLHTAELFFFEHGGKSIFFGRFLGPIRGVVPFVAGASHMRPFPFCCYSIISGILWGIIYPGLGYLGGTSWQRAETLTGRLGLLMLIVLVVTLMVLWLRHRLLPRQVTSDSQKDKTTSS